MKILLSYLIILSLIIPPIHASAEEMPSLAKKHSHKLSMEDPIYYGLQQADTLNNEANTRIPQIHTLDSSFDRKLSQLSIQQSYTDSSGAKFPVDIVQISANGVLSAQEKMNFLRLLESQDKTFEDIKNGNLEVIMHFPEDLERAQAAKEIREAIGKEVMLIEVTPTMAEYFIKVADDSTKSFVSRILQSFKDTMTFTKDSLWSLVTRRLKGSVKTYINTVYIAPTKLDQHLAIVFTGLQTGFSSIVFWGLEMDHRAFMGFLSLGILTTYALTRWRKTVNAVLKTDLKNPLKYISTTRELFSRVFGITSTIYAAQFAMGNYLNSLKYLPTPQAALGNLLTVATGEAYYATQRNRLLSSEAASKIALYSYVLMSLPSSAVNQYAKSINFENWMPQGDKIDLLWHSIRNFHLDGGIIEFSGVSLFVFGSYVFLTKYMKKKLQAVEQIGRDGLLRYTKNKLKRDRNAEKPETFKIDRQRERRAYWTTENLLPGFPEQVSRNLAETVTLEAHRIPVPVNCQAYFK